MTVAPVSLTWEERMARSGFIDPPEVFGRLRDEHPLRPMTFFDGHLGWLATGYEIVRSILADRRFSIRRDLAHPPHEMLTADIGAEPAPAGMFAGMDPPDHTRYRRLLIGEFTLRRMKRLESRIAEVTRDRLDEMERAGPPVDLFQSLALPVPSLLICELLGVPSTAREQFQRAMGVVLGLEATSEARQAVYDAIMLNYFTRLIESKRKEPTDDFYSGLINSGELTDEELVMIGVVLFRAGFETTTNALVLGEFVLLHHPEQADALRCEPTLVDRGVEELLRFPAGPGGMLRTAIEDVVIADELIKRGQTVELLPGAANRDPARFDDPDRFDIARSDAGHVSFGHGIHQCIGQQLARVEMRTVLPALLERFPDLRLAVPAEEVPMKDPRSVVFGPAKFPVTW